MLLWRKPWKKTLKSITENGINTSKSFWKFIKSFPTNKDFIGSNHKSLAKKNIVITDQKHLLAHLISTTSILWR